MSMIAKLIMGISMFCLLTAQAGNDKEIEYLDKMNLYGGCLVFVTNKHPVKVSSLLNTPEPSRISTTKLYRSNYIGEWSLKAIIEDNREKKTRVALLNTRTMERLVLGVGESMGGVTVVAANYDQECVTLRIGTNNVSLSLMAIGQQK